MLSPGNVIEEDWLSRWVRALQTRFPHRWRELAISAGNGLRSLLQSEEDMQEVSFHCANGLLSRHTFTADQLRNTGQRLLTFAVEPLESTGTS
jgi:hypothetical protein